MVALSKPSQGAGLQTWLAYIESLHDKPIDLGLERMHEMIRRMDIEFLCPVFTVAGTNGKGSTCAMLDSILRHAGYNIGMHTSPHLIRFNERVVIDGEEASDACIIAAFEQVEAARGDMTLTYFEYTGLAILKILQEAKLDAVILEVGLGGRLDAMNAIEPDCSIVCAIGIDHEGFLGTDREKIGYEKACIYRHGKPAICTDRDVPQSVRELGFHLNALLKCYGEDFETTVHDGRFDFEIKIHEGSYLDWMNLPLPALQGPKQVQNAAGVLAALCMMSDSLPVSRSAVVAGLTTVMLTARFDCVKPADATGASVTLDVGHNPQAAEARVESLNKTCRDGEQTWAVFGMLRDKNIAEVARIVSPAIDRWFVAPLNGPRGTDVQELTERMRGGGVDMSRVTRTESVADALGLALRESLRSDAQPVRIIVFGSFVTVAAAVEELRHSLAVKISP